VTWVDDNGFNLVFLWLVGKGKRCQSQQDQGQRYQSYGIENEHP